jgi:hypothetical protein
MVNTDRQITLPWTEAAKSAFFEIENCSSPIFGLAKLSDGLPSLFESLETIRPNLTIGSERTVGHRRRQSHAWDKQSHQATNRAYNGSGVRLL